MPMLRRRSVLAGTVAATFAAPAIVRAQNVGEWPKGPVKIIVPFPPGGSTDPVARIIQAKLIDNTGWNVLVDNKPGGTGAVGSAVAAKSPPDGQTWMITFDSHILNPAFAPSIPYKDSELMNVMQIGRTPQAIAAHPDRPYKTFAEVVDDARKRPGKVSMGVLAASQAFVLMTLIKKENDVDLNLIPYKGGGPLNQDILAGVTDHGRGADAGAARHADPDRAAGQRLPILFLVGRLCADRHAAANRRPNARRDHQGGACARRDAEVRRAVQHGDPDQLARGLRRLPEERAGTLVQGHQG
ncbi:MAG: tripartite tricarboxylate transporter substrate binding protein [Alphaproteobacteria bacterium]|nr:MAG: tripartite tricarboxylate transporter substrate binding protein [Alphaproteobacteria bacterium]